ncbi:PASTA domain-containing protein [Clostridium sp. DL1XJH146]
MNNDNNFLEMYGKKNNQSEKLVENIEKNEGVTPNKKIKENRKFSPKIGFGFVGIVIIAIIIYVFLAMGKTEVFDFTNWTKTDFMLWAQENEITPQTEEQYSDTVDSGKILSQSIVAGDHVKKGDIIKVVLSTGPDMTKEFDLPDIMNMTKAQIDSWATENKMSKVRISTEFSEEVPLGEVIKYEINDDSVVDKVKRSTPIYIVVSKGVEDASNVEIKVPDFKTMDLAASNIFAEENELKLTIEEDYDDYVPLAGVISQSVALDEIVHKGDEIKLVVSLGPKKFMPSFSSLSQEQATAKAAQLDIAVTVVQKYSSAAAGNFIYQSVKEGTLITEDTMVELRYSLGNKIPITDYTGMQKFELEQWMDKENAQGAGLTIKTTYTENDLAVGTVLKQDKKNVYVDRNAVISVVISSGKTLFVPDFVAPDGATYDAAITRDKAENMARDLGIVLVFVEEKNPARLNGEIWSQSVAAGSEIKEGATITLKYNPVEKTLIVPSFINKTKAQVQQMSEANNLNVEFQLENSDVVIKQSINQNTTVAYGSTIVLYGSLEGGNSSEIVETP